MNKSKQSPPHKGGRDEGTPFTKEEANAAEAYRSSPTVFRGIMRYLGAQSTNDNKS